MCVQVYYTVEFAPQGHSGLKKEMTPKRNITCDTRVL